MCPETTEVILHQDVQYYCDSEPRISASRHVFRTAMKNTVTYKKLHHVPTCTPDNKILRTANNLNFKLTKLEHRQI